MDDFVIKYVDGFQIGSIFGLPFNVAIKGDWGHGSVVSIRLMKDEKFIQLENATGGARFELRDVSIQDTHKVADIVWGLADGKKTADEIFELSLPLWKDSFGKEKQECAQYFSQIVQIMISSGYLRAQKNVRGRHVLEKAEEVGEYLLMSKILTATEQDSVLAVYYNRGMVGVTIERLPKELFKMKLKGYGLVV